MTKINKRILSGVQPSGDLHLGNYIGAIKNFVKLQNEYECFFCVVDMHAITVWQDPALLAKKTREVTAAFIASVGAIGCVFKFTFIFCSFFFCFHFFKSITNAPFVVLVLRF